MLFFRLRIPALLLAILSSGCSTFYKPVPSALVDQAHIAGLSDVRFWGDHLPDNIEELLRVQYEQTKAHRPYLLKPDNKISGNFLAISGGGQDGAFGAGFLTGWSAYGTRPKFEVVTGISTGALIAPFAFLGKNYDARLKQLYTSYSTNQLLTFQLFTGIFGGSAVMNDGKFAKLIEKFIDMPLLKKIAHEHRTGRRLFVGTTNINAGRPVIWDMGRIASFGNQQALALFRKILLASASIPVIFPPVMMNVVADKQRFQELHVDGGHC